MGSLLDDVGICLATLLPDPMAAGPTDVLAAAGAAATTGHRLVSLWSLHAETLGVERTAAALDDLGLAVGMIEAATSWADGPGPAVTAEVEQVGALAERLGAGLVLAVTLEPVIDEARAADGFAQLCEGLAPSGTGACVEFLPWTGLPTLAAAHRLVAAAGAPNGGLLLDTWHWQRQPGGPAPEVLASVPGERIMALQLCDAAAEPEADLATAAMTARLPPGDGSVDLASVLAILDDLGAHPFVASEVFAPDLLADGPVLAARRIARACASLRGA